MNKPSKQSILLIDDKPENLFATETILEKLDLNIVKAASGEEALWHVLKTDFALVLLDVQMPVMDGFETAKLMREREKSKHIPIIFLTAISKEDKHVFKGYGAGAVDYLYKPINPYILKSKVRVFCELHEQKTIIQNQMSEIKILRGLLPICSGCKKIRNESGYWEAIEGYIRDRSEADFTHGMCPECVKRLYPEIAEIILAKNR